MFHNVCSSGHPSRGRLWGAALSFHEAGTSCHTIMHVFHKALGARSPLTLLRIFCALSPRLVLCRSCGECCLQRFPGRRGSSLAVVAAWQHHVHSLRGSFSPRGVLASANRRSVSSTIPFERTGLFCRFSRAGSPFPEVFLPAWFARARTHTRNLIIGILYRKVSI